MCKTFSRVSESAQRVSTSRPRTMESKQLPKGHKGSTNLSLFDDKALSTFEAHGWG